MINQCNFLPPKNGDDLSFHAILEKFQWSFIPLFYFLRMLKIAPLPNGMGDVMKIAENTINGMVKRPSFYIHGKISLGMCVIKLWKPFSFRKHRALFPEKKFNSCASPWFSMTQIFRTLVRSSLTHPMPLLPGSSRWRQQDGKLRHRRPNSVCIHTSCQTINEWDNDLGSLE